MSRLSQQQLDQFLLAQENYKHTAKYVKQLEQQNEQVAKIISDTIMSILISKTKPLIAKLQALRLYKDIFLTAEFIMLENIETNILKIMFQAAKYKKEQQDENRGQMFFIDKEGRPNNKDSLQKGKSFLIFCLELIKNLAIWYPIEIGQSDSKYKKMYESLKNLGVTFPINNKYITNQDKTIFEKNLKSKWSEQKYSQNILEKSPIIKQSHIKQLFKQPNQIKYQNNEQRNKQYIKQLEDQNQTYKQLNSNVEGNMNMVHQINHLKSLLREYQIKEKDYQKQILNYIAVQKGLEKQITQMMVKNAQLQLNSMFKQKNICNSSNLEGLKTNRSNIFSTQTTKSQLYHSQYRRSLPKTQRFNYQNTQDLSISKRLLSTYKTKNYKDNGTIINASYNHQDQSFQKDNLYNKFTPQFKRAVFNRQYPFFQTKQFNLTLIRQNQTFKVKCLNYSGKSITISFYVLPHVFIKLTDTYFSNKTILHNQQQKTIGSFNVSIQNPTVRYLQGVVTHFNHRYEIPIPITILDFIKLTPYQQQAQLVFKYPICIHTSHLSNQSQGNQRFNQYLKFVSQLSFSNPLIITMLQNLLIKVILRIEGNTTSRILSILFESTDDVNRMFSQNLIKLFEFLFA